MKRAGTALLVLGAFLVTLGVLSPTWLYPKVAVIPAAAEIVAVARTVEPAEYFDVGTLRTVRADLQQTVTILGDTVRSEQASKDLGRDVVVWRSYSCTDTPGDDCLQRPFPLARSQALTAYDVHSAASVSWNGSWERTDASRDDDPPAGYASIKFPFDTAKSDQMWWDGDLKRSLPMQYSGETSYEGLDLYAFDQTIAPTKLGTMDVPGSLVGSDEDTVSVDRMYANRREFTIEPVTGVIIGRSESPDNWLALDGRRVLTTFRGTFTVDEQTMADTAADYRPLSLQLHLVHRVVPLVGLGVGIPVLLIGLLLQFTARRRARPTAASRPTLQA